MSEQGKEEALEKHVRVSWDKAKRFKSLKTRLGGRNKGEESQQSARSVSERRREAHQRQGKDGEGEKRKR